MNPFGDEDGDDYDSKLDPFADDDDHHVTSKKISSSITGQNINASMMNPFEESQSIINETPNEQQQQQYLLGDGSLQAEGLLCPDCMQEYRTITELMAHFDQDHRQNHQKRRQQQQQSNSKININRSKDQIKDFVKKIIQTNKSSSSPTTTEVQQEDPKLSAINGWHSKSPINSWKHSMKLGLNRSHWDDYRQIRDKQIERYVFETNKLLIRLDRLMAGYASLSSPMDIDNRRRHEQSIVEWLDERAVPLCPSCAIRFNIIIKKRHHCRLCGAVMCSKCSVFITFNFADELLKPFGFHGSKQQNLPHNNNNNNLNNNATSPTISILKLRTMLAKSIGDDNNLDTENQIESIRICIDCNRLLILRRDKLQRSHYQCPLIELYTKLRDNVQQLDRLLSIYDSMAESLNLGESTYQLQDAIEVKNKLTRLGEETDHISRKIETYDVSKTLPSQRQLSIQTLIRRSTILYLRDNLLALNELPDVEHYERLKQSHAELIQRRIQWEKQMALFEQEQFKQKHQVENVVGKKTIIFGDDGFCPQTMTINGNGLNNINIIDNNEDPIVQQMAIIQSYIEQAKQDHRYEEMRLLESNLKELEIEYFFAQQQQQQQSHESILYTNNEKSTSQVLPPSTSSMLNPFGDEDDD